MNIAILYNLNSQVIQAGQPGQWNDWEVVAIADDIRTALEGDGHTAQPFNLGIEGFEGLQAFDLVFNLAENTAGCELDELEIARRLEELEVAFTGAGSESLRRCQDKACTKSIILQQNLPTPVYQVIDPASPILTALAYPLIVKPLREDSSAGITFEAVVHEHQGLEKRVENIWRTYCQPALVEEYIDGREISAALLGSSQGLRNLPLVEELFDYPAGLPRIVTFDAKWLPGSFGWEHVQRGLPTDLSDEFDAEIKDIAAQACQALGCRDYARVDLRLRGQTPYVLEVNPNPCLNRLGSNFLFAAQAAGLTFENIINEIVASALRRKKSPR